MTEPALTTGAAYERVRQRHLAALTKRLGDEVAKRQWTLEQLHAERDVRLRRLLAHAKAHSPWHRERLHGIDPADVDATSLSGLPTMTKSDLMQNWDDIVTDRRLTLHLAERSLEASAAGLRNCLFGEFHVVASGGSSGRRGVFVFDRAALVGGVAPTMRFLRWVDAELPSTTHAVRTAFVQATKPTHLSAVVAGCFSAPADSVALSPSDPIDASVRAINEFEPTRLTGYPSALHALAQEALDGRLRAPICRVHCQAEPLFENTRALLAEAFGPVLDVYGASEAMSLAAGWYDEPFLRLNEDNAVVEALDERGVACEIGLPSSRMLVTNVVNRSLPLIRYRLDDELTFLPGDARRPGRPVLIRGRSDDVFRYGDITVHPHTLRSVLCHRSISEFQVRQLPDGIDVDVRMTGDDPATLREPLRAALASAGMPGGRVSIAAVERIERDVGTGKLRRFVPLTTSSATKPTRTEPERRHQRVQPERSESTWGALPCS